MVKTGDTVTWKAPGGTAKGKVEKKLTTKTKIKGHEIKATKDDPQFLVKTDDGKKAAHKPSALKKA